jgi:hypothetical protein
MHPLRFCLTILMSLSSTLTMGTETDHRRVYLNGIDISSAKHQVLQKVTVRIDGQGHIFIEAPHYEVTEESTYIPLSSLSHESGTTPRHRQRGPIPPSHSKVEPTEPLQPLAKQAKPLDNNGKPILQNNQESENARQPRSQLKP